MLETGHIENSGFSAWMVNAAHNGLGDDVKPQTQTAVAVAREFFSGNMANVCLSARQVNKSVSMLQVFTAAAETVGSKLGMMRQLADTAAKGLYTSKEKTAAQKQLQSLAAEINKIAGQTEYDDNKLFTAGAKTITIPLADGTNLHVFAQDLSINAAGLDLTSDASGALVSIKRAQSSFSEYCDYLDTQSRYLENSMSIVESESSAVCGLEPDGFDSNMAAGLAGYIADKLQQYRSVSLKTQANVSAAQAVSLLDYTGRYVGGTIE